MKGLFELADFVRKIYLQKRFGQLSPLTILRAEVQGQLAECDWLMRSKCTWDTNRPPGERARNASLQAIQDALSVRELLFCVLPQVESARVRVYRRSPEDQIELVIAGTLRRSEQASKKIPSLAMRGKLCGLQFRMSEEGLEALPADEWQGRSAPEFLENVEISTNGGSLNGR